MYSQLQTAWVDIWNVDLICPLEVTTFANKAMPISAISKSPYITRSEKITLSNAGS